MKFYSTKNKSHPVTFREAVMNGIPDDGGLYMPQYVPRVSGAFLPSIASYEFQEIAYIVAQQYIDDIPDNNLQSIIQRAINFDAPLVQVTHNISILELFHGPTLAFKDFGARFLANIMAHYMQNENKELIILVATSGDTGSAVAHGFYDIEGIKVLLLYPSKKVSWIQEQQLTTMNRNIYAFEVQGTFDDCQQLVKRAFLDTELKKRFYLSSANSINIARLLPQSFYYFYAYAQLPDKSNTIIISVPSGNFGNLTAGLLAKNMGLPVDVFIAAVNKNDIFPVYLKTGKFVPKAAVKTLSNAMDVGNPSNFYRIVSLYENNIEHIRRVVHSESISDEQTKAGIREVYNKYNYIIDPHGAVAYVAMKNYSKMKKQEGVFILLETAHPAKFYDIVNETLKIEVQIPHGLSVVLNKRKESIEISSEFVQFKSYILDQFSK